MGKLAFVFPGQGSQEVGMGKDVYDAVPAAREAFETADRVLGFPLTEMIFEGPESGLKQTSNTQPALLATSWALYQALERHGIRPDYVAGHSLGEYGALVAAGVLRFEDAIAIVRQRGQFMEQAVPSGQGAMAAVLGAERERLGALCDDISAAGTPVEMANLNCPGQIVVSGSREGIDAAVERGKEAGAKRVIPLEVSGPFHSAMMKPAAERLGEALRAIEMQDACIPVIANVTARPVTEAEQIRGLLVEQVFSPVLWEDSVRYLIDQGVDTFVEIGSGKVLSGLIKKIDRSVRIVSINSLEAIEAYE
ncbi:ACP S-malonyltransferase [Paenibacillus thiaminolyticus]|uniref:Malonyl CoA-acyl carrier protein transacylase n=1 Tax=Paenibacillus thiaminolyticus TaxID=49283 RepID=A0AAP9J3M4_PANTH|nr:ACP S-malonyltransferase [Paenibacillus thiaminolyticus]MCY9536878.1 ACP S-malonyltransferase [Paenibacillus thiaminolyticus]MCY9604528.1 ACP S-malonyltransferase [Paenibacillus thiaminolyticus]MCY9608447.1 ACP S-malonyltransferase [Paenibacillus thiaminolyticus]MCY9613985.1 ACP S-malonyltransferase [Paenibacillus thiaminolyticus]MCY9621905.1 ACP S-malonyltransferase [Paenibacillus thiaminolyticus]